MKCVQIEKEITKIKYKTKQNKWNLVQNWKLKVLTKVTAP